MGPELARLCTMVACKLHADMDIILAGDTGNMYLAKFMVDDFFPHHFFKPDSELLTSVDLTSTSAPGTFYRSPVFKLTGIPLHKESVMKNAE